MFAAKRRGKYEQLELDGKPVVARVRGCVVTKVFESQGKRYATLDMSSAIGDKQLLLDADEFIRARASPRFSPLRFAWTQVTVKIVINDELRYGSILDVELSPGAFGAFGWCLLLKKISNVLVLQKTSTQSTTDTP
jgi:hypothetical protein